jgi:hypothetical protein
VRRLSFLLLIGICQGLLLPVAASADDLLLDAEEALPGKIAIPATLLSAEWLHYFTDGSQASGGASSYTVGDFRRTLALGAASLPLAASWKLNLETKLGSAGDENGNYAHYEGAAQLVYQVSAHTYLALGDRYLSEGLARGTLLEAGVTEVFTPGVSLMAKLLTTASGNLNSDAGFLQADFYGRLHWIAGAAAGKADPRLNQFFVSGAGRFAEGFGAVGTEAFGAPLTFYVKLYSSASILQWGLALSVKVPCTGAR